MKTLENMHVLLLKGGNGTEREVSLNTAKVCSSAIKKIGHKITEVDISKMDILGLKNFKLSYIYLGFFFCS